MALTFSNCSLTEVKQSATGGSTVSGQTVNLTLTPDAGYVLSAEHFLIGGDVTKAIANYGTSSATFTFTENVSASSNFAAPTDAEVTQVVFSDNGVPGDVKNTVNIAVTTGSFSMGTANRDMVIDLNAGTGAVVAVTNRSVAFRTRALTGTGHSISYSEGSGITAGSSVTTSAGHAQILHSGTVTEGVSSLVLTATFAITSGYQYRRRGPEVTTELGVYEKHYRVVTKDTVDGDGFLTHRVFKVYYEPPVDIEGLDPDPTDMEVLNHVITFNH